MKSIITNSNTCYICGTNQNLQTHHCIFESKRELADKDGLTVKLCATCHHAIHIASNKFDLSMQNALKKIAQEKWEEKYGDREQFIERYEKSYL